MSLKQKLKDGRTVIGSWISTASPIAAELMASTGFDFLTVDAEHSSIDLAQTQVLFQAMRAGNPDCAPLVRMPGITYAETKRYLDSGAAGVIAPMVNSTAQAEELIRAVKYPPEGMRGVGFCRANGYGHRLREVMETANAESFVCVQIEHVDALKNIDAILAVQGIDAAMIGPYDLSASMGITGQFEHKDMVSAASMILDACRKHGVFPGIHVVQPDSAEVLRRANEGYRFVAYSLDITMLLNACVNGLEEIRKNLSPLP